MVEHGNHGGRHGGDRRGAAWLDAELTRREEAETRMAASLLELDRHPGHQLLSTTRPTGTTLRRWAVAQEALAGLWRDFGVYRSTVRAARAVRGRRSRPGERELAELHRLLVEPSIEVSRTAVALPERGLTGPAERVETLSLDAIGRRMDQAFREISDVVVAADAAHSGFLAALVPVMERLADARRVAAELTGTASTPDTAAVTALTDRIAALEREATADPLGHGGAAALDGVGAEIAAVAARLDGQAAQRDRWAADLADVGQRIDALSRLREEAERARVQATELIAGAPPPLPTDPLRRLRDLLAAARAAPDWAARASGMTALRTALDDTDAELRAARELSTGLLDRRAELRGRFGAFRARAARLRRAEEPAVLELDARIQRLLWTKPCDLAAATRALADYRRYLGGAAPPRIGTSISTTGSTGPSGEGRTP